MKIRTELNDLASNIRALVEERNTENQDLFTKIPITIYGFNKKIEEYERQEVSLKGRIEVAQNLYEALDLLNQATSSESKDLIQVIKNLNQFILSSRERKENVDRQFEHTDSIEIVNNLNKKIHQSTKESIRQDAYRTLKNIPSSKETYMHTITKDFPFPGYLHVKKNLDIFLAEYKTILSDKQSLQITGLIPLLENGFEIDRQISELYELKNKVDPAHRPKGKDSYEDLLKSMFADIVYNITSSIESLKAGERFIFPGGLDDNRYVLYEVQRQEDGKYQFAIINTGEDADFGQEFWRTPLLRVGLINQAKTPIFSDLPLEAVTDQMFIEELVQFQASAGVPKLGPRLMESVYKTISKQLSEKYQGQQSLRELHMVQAWGPTSFDPVMAYLEYALPPSIFIPFQYDMILRARVDLNKMLPKAFEEEVFPPQLLDFIDQESCKTIAEWKAKFEQHCVPKGDLLVAQDLIGNLNIQDEETLRQRLEEINELAFILKKFTTALKTLDMINHQNNTFLYFALPAGIVGSIATLSPVAIISTLAIAKRVLDSNDISSSSKEWVLKIENKLLEIVESECEFSRHIIYKEFLRLEGQKQGEFTFPETEKIESTKDLSFEYLKMADEIFQKTSPEQAIILKNRQQSFIPSISFVDSMFTCGIDQAENSFSLAGLDLQNMFNYLQNLFQEIALCAPPLLNETQSPLRDALAGCNMLTVTT